MLRFTAIYHDRAPLCSPTETPPSADKQNKTHFCIYYILYGKHASHTIYGTYRSKTVVKNFLYATICHDLPPIRRNRSPAKAPAVAYKDNYIFPLLQSLWAFAIFFIFIKILSVFHNKHLLFFKSNSIQQENFYLIRIFLL